MIKRAFKAASYAEEKQLLIEKGGSLAGSNFDWGALQEFRAEFKNASVAARSDREVVLAVVSAQGLLLEHCGAALQDDFDVALAAVKSHGRALKHVSEELRSNREIVLEAVQQRGLALMFAGEEMLCDQELVLTAVSRDGAAISYASPTFFGEKDIVLAAVGTFPWALNLACEALQGDKEIMLKALRQQALERQAQRLQRGGRMEQGPGPGHSVLYCGSEALRADREVVMEALQASWESLGLASPELKSDKDFVLFAIRLVPPNERMECWHKADDDLRRAISWPSFRSAAESFLACPGETAPILVVTLHQTGPGSKESQEESATNMSFDFGFGFVCEATLLVTGKSFTCSLASQDIDESQFTADDDDDDRTTTAASASAPSEDGDSDVNCRPCRPYLILNDLAKKLVDELPNHTQAGSPERVFIIFANDDHDELPATPWEWDRPLADYISGASRR
mmetsp:Transcript_11829/g.26079  ORF Transcript_11829/g.26079 Transcript_11829/m.26079 type:complete len:455 (-) Transcript_11829:397-1761(-)|eukprot:CAMPEP_0206468052 /NCGR_PEP_ID=MMETSP0324_2-20121206/29390_1 /ASSEMBLY_ACC=CAM_ASM_000836 /TAXON_ID=2866 /ORGANISM="Crypthecodinium cohnii, Strain Seligo" /LENGTH=454 /DNA_ID=CAMNT_0053941417 /DNA_START=102 /DNA_END=1466 /DNA_ORIENTATION=+